MTFKDLNLNTPLQNILEELGYIYPTPIQVKSLPIILSGRDIVGVAQTGTGKTFAYLLPILKSLKYSEQRHPRVLIVVPTRELVVQVVKEIEKLTKYITCRYAGIYGGTNINTQKQLIYDGLDILVATPGRLLDLAIDKNLRLKSIQKLVIDEVDEMLNLGFRTQLINVLDLLPQKRQNLLFSATLTKDVNTIIQSYFNHPETVEIAPTGTPLDLIIQKAYLVPNFYTKVNLLEHLLKDDSFTKVLIFVESKKLADRLAEHLEKSFGEQMGVIHSNKSQNFRLNAIKKFETGAHRILIATELIARGIDINDVTHVINFDTPKIPENYIHRIGRTGRADKAGIAITFINEVEEAYQQAIESLMKIQIPLLDIPKNVEISTKFTDDERPNLMDKNYLKKSKLKGQGAFHTKKDKNKKQNIGGSYKLKIKAKYKKPQTRSAKSKKK
ncbi:MAG TPA: DEAD/DEAH box helicase [Crocinitomix sp.]|nr:DEAD/DEAH box helicase [Crocinitomix sp.]